jgi:hypothetical protein
MNINSNIYHYYFNYCVDPVIICSVFSFAAFIYGITASIENNSIQYLPLCGAAVCKVPVGVYNYFSQDVKSLNIGIGALWFFGFVVNVLAAITEGCRIIYFKIWNYDDRHVNFSISEFDYGSVERRKNRWGFEFLFIDLYMTLELLPKIVYKHGGLLDGIIILDQAFEWSKQLTDKKRPLTIVTMGAPLFAVDDFDVQNGEEEKQYEFARNYVLFADPDAQIAVFYELKTREIVEFCVKKKVVRIGEDSQSNPIFDTIIRFREPEKPPRVLLYSTINFCDEEVFYRKIKDRFHFVRAILSFRQRGVHLTVNVIIKRILKTMRTGEWFNIYKGRVRANYIIKAFPEIKIIAKKKDEMINLHNQQCSSYEVFNMTNTDLFFANNKTEYFLY